MRGRRFRSFWFTVLVTTAFAWLLVPGAAADPASTKGPATLLERARQQVGTAERTSTNMTAQSTESGSRSAIWITDDGWDAIDARGDLTDVRVNHGTSRIVTRARVATMVDPRTDPNWAIDTETALTWALDTDLDGLAEHAVFYFVDEWGDIVAFVAWFDDVDFVITCTGVGYYDASAAWYRASFSRACFGKPDAVRLAAHMAYDYDPWMTISEDIAPDYGLSQRAAKVARYATTLQASVSDGLITAGQTVKVRGTLTRSSNGKTLADRKVVLFRRYGDGSWKRLGVAQTNSKGKVVFADTPRKNATYQLRHPKDAQSKRAVSGEVGTRVRPKMSLAAKPGTTVARGDTVRLRAAVAPYHGGHRVAFQRKTSSGWETVARRRLNSNSVAVYRFTATNSTIGRYRVVLKAHDDHARGVSNKRAITYG